MNSPKGHPNVHQELVRSPLLLDRRCSLLLIVDVQEKLMPFIRQNELVQWNLGRLIQAAKILNVPIAGTEQYPEGLGPTIEPIRSQVGQFVSKRMFSCRECADFVNDWLNRGIRQIIVAGIEAHVCILQSALDLVGAGWDVFIPADAVGSRSELDHCIGLRRLEQSGVTIVTTESVLFEWCESSGTSEFKQISQLVKQTSPT